MRRWHFLDLWRLDVFGWQRTAVDGPAFETDPTAYASYHIWVQDWRSVHGADRSADYFARHFRHDGFGWRLVEFDWI